MSLPSRWIPPVPEETSEVARAAFPKGHPYMQMRDELGSLYTNDMFADLYPKDGQTRRAALAFGASHGDAICRGSHGSSSSRGRARSNCMEICLKSEANVCGI